MRAQLLVGSTGKWRLYKNIQGLNIAGKKDTRKPCPWLVCDHRGETVRETTEEKITTIYSKPEKREELKEKRGRSLISRK